MLFAILQILRNAKKVDLNLCFTLDKNVQKFILGMGWMPRKLIILCKIDIHKLLVVRQHIKSTSNQEDQI